MGSAPSLMRIRDFVPRAADTRRLRPRRRGPSTPPWFAAWLRIVTEAAQSANGEPATQHRQRRLRPIPFHPAKALWANDKSGFFRAEFFHLGFLYKQPVEIFEVVTGQSKRIRYSPAMFTFDNGVQPLPPDDADLDFAGFRVHAARARGRVGGNPGLRAGKPDAIHKVRARRDAAPRALARVRVVLSRSVIT